MGSKIEKHPFTFVEDRILLNFVLSHGPHNWALLKPLLPNRTPRQCRERWHTHLNPAINQSPWTHQEDTILAEKQRILGNKWAEIAKFLTNRTDSQIKNRWNTSVKSRAAELTAHPPVHPLGLQTMMGSTEAHRQSGSGVMSISDFTTIPPLHMSKP
jgi:hypothetical protein